ncbi:DUF4178 domain-containing protein [Asticcacaulis benevestitus]|uniref:DUF4178 domain-containing protein n=1 Tax=Asticcacaulis benevestitus DSM 16100 = ATCC BAA-896 TaxID=1121022 RepID=V4R719_9CAUL|nr:DUF4178 domain-containing protein [Asticcacaulis benevestitus]ESQ87253.1 hypothetical protein ABENE_17270 [Asticcacaulis benevestitus DSM 16100 = ATCC BAA-896]
MTETRFGQRPTAKSVKAFQCPNCGGPIELRAVGITVTAVCRQCSSIIDAANPDLRVIQAARQAACSTSIEIGSRGELYGVVWEVIGYTRKSVRGTIYAWDEYLLFNPWEGFRFLSQSNGHWTFFKRQNSAIDGIGRRNSLTLSGHTYTVFNKDYVVVESVKGEFYWRVKIGDESYAADYIRPPYMLSSEATTDEINISLGMYVDKAVLKKAFPEARLPSASGVGACQPPPYHDKAGKIVQMGLLAACAAIVLHIAMGIALPSQTMVDITGQPIVVKPSPPNALPVSGAMWGAPNETSVGQTEGQTLKSEPFVLPRNGNIRIDTSTWIYNGWADFDLTLVNDKTSVSFPIKQSVSYYHGVDDGESWSEGKNKARTWVSNVPAGTYHLLIESESDQFTKDGQLPFNLTLRRGVNEMSNLWIALFLIAIYPAIVLFRRWSFESQRWSNSDYTPGGDRNEGNI